MRTIYLFIPILFFGMNIGAQNVVSYNNHNDSYLNTLVTDLHPAIYINELNVFRYSSEPKLVVITDVVSLIKLYTYDPEYHNVELIQIRLNSTSDESALLNINRLNSFTNLKYIIFTYNYNACNAQSDDGCLGEKTSAMITHSPDSNIEFYYSLSIRH